MQASAAPASERKVSNLRFIITPRRIRIKRTIRLIVARY
jgi:hypothetical protein